MANEEVCEIKPVQCFLSTNLNNKNKTFGDIKDRILRQLGYPMISVHLHDSQIYDAISIAIELFTKYAGYTEETLIFDSRIYERNKGLRLDKLFTVLANPSPYDSQLLKSNYNQTVEKPAIVYAAIATISKDELPSTYYEDIVLNTLVSADEYDTIVTYNPLLCSLFKRTRENKTTIEGVYVEEETKQFEKAFDYDLMDYRRVIEVTQFSESSNKSVTQLFSFESALASQAFYTFQFSTRGFDLLSFHTLQEFIKTRNRVLALDRQFSFDNRNQIFTLIPQPTPDRGSFYGILTCKIERPIREIIDRMWVFEYALAQCKVMLGTNRGTMGAVQLAGGGVMNDNLNLRSEGLKEMENLKKELMSGSAYSENKPPLFFIG